MTTCYRMIELTFPEINYQCEVFILSPPSVRIYDPLHTTILNLLDRWSRLLLG